MYVPGLLRDFQRGAICFWRHIHFGALVVLLIIGLVQPVQAFTVSGNKILDDMSRPVTLKGVSWFGFETEAHAVHGLWARNWRQMLDQIQATGFNALRVPLCPDSFRNPSATLGTINANLNPDTAGLTPQQFLDVFLTEVDRRGMYILLDMHRINCKNQTELWHTAAYSEDRWLSDLEYLAQHYSGLRNLVGIDLFNEPHGQATWGTGNRDTDWKGAAERAAAKIIAVNSTVLIFVEGIQSAQQCSSNTAHWWGGNLEPQRCFPLAIPENKLVLSPHVYGPDISAHPYFDDPTFPANMPAIWDAHFGQFAAGTPVVIGEAGSKYGHGGTVKEKIWLDALFAYLKKRGDINLFYWSWNPNSIGTGGILQDDWQTVWPDKVALLKDLWNVTPPPKPTSGPSAGISSTLKINSDWGTGYCADVSIKNSGTVPVQWNTPLVIQGRISRAWNVVLVQQGANHRASGMAWNRFVNAGGIQSFGFCAKR